MVVDFGFLVLPASFFGLLGIIFVSPAGSFIFSTKKNATTTAATTTASDTTDDENVRRGGIAVKMALCKSQSVIPSNWSNDMGKSNSSREREYHQSSCSRASRRRRTSE
jgi:hypothetical protein